MRITIDLSDEVKWFLTELFNNNVQGRLDRIERLLEQIKGMEIKEMASIDDLISDVQSESTVVDGVVTLINSLKEQLKAQGLDQGKIDAAFAAVEANKGKLASALTDNTTAATPASPPTGP